MMRAWMFPGQGSQSPGMGRRLFSDFALAREIFAEAMNRSGLDLERFRAVGPANELARPEVAEPIIAATQIAYASVLMEAGVSPDVVGGYSAGEVAAYFAAGVLSRSDSLQAAVIRGRILSKYTNEATRMIAVARVPSDLLNELLVERFNNVEIAGKNADDNHTLVGDHASIVACSIELRQHGGAISDVSVSGPWHSKSITRASDEILEQFSPLEFRTPDIELSTSCSGVPEKDPIVLARHLAQQVSSTVLWNDIVTRWMSKGVRQFTELGPGRVLLGLLRQGNANTSQYHVECVESASGSIAALKRLLENPLQGIVK